MVSPTKDQQIEDSSASDNNLDSNNSSEDTSASNPPEDDQSTFDVVMAAIKPEGEDDGDDDANSDKDESDKAAADASKDGKAKDEEGESDEPSEDEIKAWKPKTRQRFEKLQAKYRDASERLEKAEVDAGHYRNFVDFLDTNGIDQDEANKLFAVGAMLKNDPFGALAAITPYYNDLLEITGQILPPDLKQQVEAGYLTQAHALEISRGRARVQVQPAIQQDQQERQQQRVSRQQGQTVAQMQSAIGSWEQKWSTSDPDYSVKKDRVLDRLELMLARAQREGKLPQNAEQAISLAEKARKDVEAELRQFKVKKPVSMVDGGGANSSHLPEPKDTKDVIRRTLNK
jgi:hypothetical protein